MAEKERTYEEKVQKLDEILTRLDNSETPIDKLSEDSGLENSEIASTGNFYSKGAPVAPWAL